MAGKTAGARGVVSDVDDLAVWAANKEPPNAPRFGGEGMDDLVSPLLHERVGRIDVVDLDRHHRVLRRRGIPSDDLDARAGVGRFKPDDPTLIHGLVDQFEGSVEFPSAVDVIGMEVGNHFDRSRMSNSGTPDGYARWRRAMAVTAAGCQPCLTTRTIKNYKAVNGLACRDLRCGLTWFSIGGRIRGDDIYLGAAFCHLVLSWVYMIPA